MFLERWRISADKVVECYEGDELESFVKKFPIFAMLERTINQYGKDGIPTLVWSKKPSSLLLNIVNYRGIQHYTGFFLGHTISYSEIFLSYDCKEQVSEIPAILQNALCFILCKIAGKHILCIVSDLEGASEISKGLTSELGHDRIMIEGHRLFSAILYALGSFSMGTKALSDVRISTLTRLPKKYIANIKKQFVSSFIPTYMPAFLGMTPTSHNVLIFPGRFQPPHKGHFEVIHRILKKDYSLLQNPSDYGVIDQFDKLIVVPAPLFQLDGKNWLEPLERKRILEMGLMDLKRLDPELIFSDERVEIITATRYTEPEYDWLPRLVREIATTDNVLGILTANPKTEILQGLHPHIRIIPTIRSPENEKKYKGELIRNKLIDDRNQELRNLLLPSTLDYLYKVSPQVQSLVERLKGISTEH